MNMTTPYHKKPCSLNLEIFIISTDSHSYHFSWKLSQGRFLKKQCICIYTLCLYNIIIPVSGHALAQERWFQESWFVYSRRSSVCPKGHERRNTCCRNYFNSKHFTPKFGLLGILESMNFTLFSRSA